jgi:hypothetical protein
MQGIGGPAGVVAGGVRHASAREQGVIDRPARMPAAPSFATSSCWPWSVRRRGGPAAAVSQPARRQDRRRRRSLGPGARRRPGRLFQQGGAAFNLLRDDLGKAADFTGLNCETSYSRGILPGEYTVNLHLYRNRSRGQPVPATVVASARGSGGQETRQLLASEVQLAREGEELTVFRFELTDQGRLVPGSAHSIFKPLRSRSES